MKTIIINLFFITISLNLLAQTQITNLEPSDYYDFWLGNWDLTWEKSDDSIGKGENSILKILDGNVIQENFKVIEDSDIQNFTGKSWSVYNKNNGKWYQTWVDNQGAYLDFVGEIDGNKRIFKRTAEGPNGKEFLQRMVFYDIKPDSFTWDWEISKDNGKTWILRWRINYKRKGAY